MNHYTQYVDYHVGLLKDFQAASQPLPPFTTNADQHPQTEEDNEFINTLGTLCQIKQYDEETSAQGQWLITRVVSAYSHLMPLLSRDLLWFFGGDGLHYMPDEEINFYQQLDELRFSAEEADKAFDYASAKASLQSKQ